MYQFPKSTTTFYQQQPQVKLHKVNPIRPRIKNQLRTVQKLEIQKPIVSFSAKRKDQEQKFQTEEEIETQTQTEKIRHFPENQTKKSKNSFTRMRRAPIDMLDQLKYQKLSLYHCDSIAIRPAGKVKCIQNQKENHTSLGGSVCEEIKQRRSKMQTQLKKRKSIFGGIKKSVALQNLQQSRMVRTKVFESLPPHLRRQEFHITVDTDQITECCI